MANNEVLYAIAGFEEHPVAGAIFELDGTVLAVNTRALQVMGRDRAQIVGRKVGEIGPFVKSAWRDFVAAGDQAEALEALAARERAFALDRLGLLLFVARDVHREREHDVATACRTHRQRVLERAGAVRALHRHLAGVLAGGDEVPPHAAQVGTELADLVSDDLLGGSPQCLASARVDGEHGSIEVEDRPSDGKLLEARHSV